MSFKNNYHVRTAKYFLYKRFTGTPKWRIEYLFDRALKRLRPGDIAIDCGANVGRYTRMMAAKGATVHAFEPDPRNFKILTAHLGALPNVLLHQVAVDAESGRAKLYISNRFADDHRNREGSTLLKEKQSVHDLEHFDVEKVDFVSFLNKLGRKIALIKMDIEGAELNVLSAMLQSDAFELVEHMFVETHERQVASRAEEFALLRKRLKSRYGSRINLDWR